MRPVARQKLLDANAAREIVIAMILATTIRVVDDVDAFHAENIGSGCRVGKTFFASTR